MHIEGEGTNAKDLLRKNVERFDAAMLDGLQNISSAPLSGLRLEYALNAMSCYLHAVHTSTSSHNTRLILSRVLRLLQCDDPSGRLAAVFDSHVEDTLMWSWIVWIPQLLSLLDCRSSKHVLGILKGLANMFPQAIYYSLRAYLLERKDEHRMASKKRKSSAVDSGKSEAEKSNQQDASNVSNDTDSNAKNNSDNPTVSANSDGAHKTSKPAASSSTRANETNAPKTTLQHTEDLMQFLRRMHTSLVFEIEFFLEEVFHIHVLFR